MRLGILRCASVDVVELGHVRPLRRDQGQLRWVLRRAFERVEVEKFATLSNVMVGGIARVESDATTGRRAADRPWSDVESEVVVVLEVPLRAFGGEEEGVAIEAVEALCGAVRGGVALVQLVLDGEQARRAVAVGVEP